MSRTTDRPQAAAGPIDPAADLDIEASLEVLDVDVLHDLLSSLNQPTAVAAVYRKFVGNATDFIESLRVQQGAAFIETLHTLKGSAAMLGAKCLALRAARLQAQAESFPVQVEQAIELLTAELAKFRAALEHRLSAISESGGESPRP